jgi:methyl-accepting chemotaxis protein
MKLKFRLSIIVISILLVVITLLSVILVSRARDMQTRSVSKSIERLDSALTNDLRRRYETYLQIAIDLTAVLGNFRDLAFQNRRENIIDNMASIVKSQESVIGAYSCWYPGLPDGDDAAHTADDTATEKGQFIPWITKESGKLEIKGYKSGYESALAELIDAQVILDPVKRTISGEDTLIYDIRIPIKDDNGKIIGLVGIQVSLNATLDYILSKTADADKSSEVVLMQVISNNGTIIAHSDKEKVGQNIMEANKELLNEKRDDVLASIQDGKFFSLLSHSSLLETRLYLVFTPLFIGNNPNAWSVMVGCAEDVVFEEITQMTRFAIIVSIISITAAAILVHLIAASITKPIINVALTLKNISEGEGDLTKSINVKAKDEVGDLARYFNATLAKIRELVITIKTHAAGLFDIGNELASNMTETAAAINEITANIQSIKGRVINQSASVTETNATMEQITVNIDKLNSTVEQQSSSVSKSSSAIEQMIANIQSVSNTLAKNTDNVNGLIEASDIGRNGLQEVSTDIQEIARESEGLLEINAVMENIASQTNLLSMNAAIEAAHAGEAGKGFAVVADEIRKLAENSGEQSKTISAVLKKIKDSIDKITKSADDVLGEFAAIDSGVRTVSEQAENIRNAMEEQSVGSRQILEVIGQLNEITRQVKGGSDEMLEGSKEVIQEGKNLELVTQEITNGMNEMATGADQINAAVTQVNEISGQNRENINTLVQEVSKFRVE